MTNLPAAVWVGLASLWVLSGCLETARTEPNTFSSDALASARQPSPVAGAGAVRRDDGAVATPPNPGNPLGPAPVPAGGTTAQGGGAAPQPGPAGTGGRMPPLGGAPAEAGAPSPSVPSGTETDPWSYHEVDGAVCRDGSPAGYYLRRGSSDDLLIFLNGGGICYDDFFCGINPANVNQSLPGETLLGASLEQLTASLLPQRQRPPEDGILARDDRNPVADASMVFVPYCTGDVYAGTKRDAPVITSQSVPPQQFVGYTNLGLIYRDLDPALVRSKRVVLAGSSAGSFGALLNYQRTAEFFSEATVFALADSGVAFRDEFLEPCVQKIWRELWGMDEILPVDCTGCFNPDGGGLAEGLGTYLFKEKYAGRMLGGLVSSSQDQIMKLFFSAGLNQCKTDLSLEAVAAAIGLGSYPPLRYPRGIADFIDRVAGREQMASYVIEGDLHQHIFRARFYEDNGLGLSIAAWFGRFLDGDAQHLGHAPP